MLLISNMYPSNKNPTYGIFVKNIESQLFKTGIITSRKVVIDEHGGPYLWKAIKYIYFYISIIFCCLFCKYDFIYTHHLSFTALPLLFCVPFLKRPLIANAHGNDVIPTNLLKNLLFLFARVLSHQSRLVIVPSMFFQHETCKRYRLPLERTYVYPSGGVNLDIFFKTDKIMSRVEMGFSENDFVLAYVSRIDKGKGWHLFLKALHQLRNDFPVKALIVGWGDEINQFEKMVIGLKLTPIVKAIHSMNHNQINTVYNAADVFVFPTMLVESLGLVGLEAMATGLPVVGSKIGGIQDYLVDGRNGYFFKPGDLHDLQDKIAKYCYLAKADKQKMSSFAIETAKKYDSNVVDVKLANKLKEIIKLS
jgi:L-malate glycosyltransferase